MFGMFLLTGMVLGFMMSTYYLLMNYGELSIESLYTLLTGNRNFEFETNHLSKGDIDEKEVESWEEDYLDLFSNGEPVKENKTDLMEKGIDETSTRGGLLKEEQSLERPEKKRGDNMTDLFQTNIELLKLPVLIGENDVQRMLVSDLELDFTAQKVRNIDASIRDLTYEVIADKVIVQGVVHKQVFYVTEDNIVQHQAEDVPFSLFVDIPGVQPGMDVDIDPIIEDIKVKLLEGGAVLHQKVILKVNVLVEEVQQLFVETGEGALSVVDRVIGENENQTMIESAIELDIPAIKITDIVAKLQDLETEVIKNKVIIQGILHKQIFFIGEDNVEYHQAEDVPFSHFVDLPGAEPGMDVQVHPNIEHIKRELINEGTTLSQEVVASFFVKVTEEVQLNVASGNKLVRLREVLGENTKQILNESTLALDVPAIKVKDIDVSVVDIETQVITNKIIIQGIIHKQIYFIGEDNVEYHQAEDVSFSTFIDLPGAAPNMTGVTVKPKIEFVKPILNPTGEELTQKVVMELFVKAFREPPAHRQIAVVSVPPYGV
ncbi:MULTISPECIES: DUF3794 domain-containing protein [unclassified Candidatus Frackibacter]|uniref:DUF3794 domain-containing protein n=1 Tax=unclassified Candidatus Frackibacter TaxID=2648818 RepID=UPI000889A069|nr:MULTISPECIES: DUF3794 domain-containing protein [unclassified Candidatus Frackibacter]SDC65880.1 protein of unknown function [Candidatus Frackibacter sp. WG11]SEM79017.1 protein of unknown function [Candidatus Frackibacter sp. WG12]SFL89790.1 protein of unknown function [Candidatus Frackibacter sp. WG13]